MKPIRADDEIEAPLATMFEFNMHLIAHIAQAGDPVSEDDFAGPADPVADQRREVTARECDISPARELPEHLDTES